MKSHIAKENNIGPAVSEILWYKQTDILLLLLFVDYDDGISRADNPRNTN